MKKLIAILVIASMLPKVTWAADSPINITTGSQDSAVVAISKGQICPFTGVLFNKTATASVIVEYSTSAEKTEIQVRKAVADSTAQHLKETEDLRAQCKAEKSILNSSIVSLNDTLSLKNEENVSIKKQLSDSPDRLTWFGVGFVGGLAFTLATVFATSSLTK